MSVVIGYPSFMTYQMMKGKKDNNDGFPSIPGMIARYSALGLTNEEMSKNPVWVDKTGNGYDLQLKNFAWGGMSGVGGYEMNFNLWTNNVPSISDISMSKTTTSVSVSVGNSAYNNNLIYIHKNNWDINKNHWLKVASTYEDGDLLFIFYNDKNTKKIELPANGYANIPAYPEFKGSYMYISTTSNKQGSFTIEQLPLDHDATEEELTKIKDYFVKTYPWLFPDQAWTVVGKTNEDEDRATIANITGNGNNLVLSNFGFAEGSGYNEEGEYAGYLVTDGVDDKVQSSSFTMNEDWTIVGDWELLSNVQINCGIVKAQNVYLYNIANGLLISINNPRSLQSFGTKSLHAICSDGRLYDRNWVEYEYTVDQNFAIVESSLNIGFNLNNYTQIAFKNLGIYNNQILSKEDCIKAYNYLQTLKAK